MLNQKKSKEEQTKTPKSQVRIRQDKTNGNNLSKLTNRPQPIMREYEQKVVSGRFHLVTERPTQHKKILNQNHQH